MRALTKIVAFVAIGITLTVLIYIGYLWATYIDESFTSGSAHGFTIGSEKEDTYKHSKRLLSEYPESYIYISYGNRAGDNFSLPIKELQLEKIEAYENWNILLDGKYKFHNIIRLSFKSGSLDEIYRHRKHFELP